jgi:hypothetical protein
MRALNFWKLIIIPALFFQLGNAVATDYFQANLTISKIRAVGDYQGTKYDNTIEIWFSSLPNWPSGAPCTNALPRVIIDAKNKQLVAAAYLAMATGKKIDINVDDTLPIRDGACEVSYLDVPAQ